MTAQLSRQQWSDLAELFIDERPLESLPESVDELVEVLVE